jgi:hypothetical protein
MARLKDAMFAATTVWLGLIAGFVVLEGAVRSFAIAPAIEPQHGDFTRAGDLPYSRKPLSRQTGRNTTDEFDYDYRHNSLGFRDVEHESVKGEGIFRILGLGDSFTYGVGAAFEDTYLFLLEKMLNERSGSHPRIEIIKVGIPRYFPETQRMLLEKYGLQFDPDLILVGFLPNDVIDTYFGLDAVVVDADGYLKSRPAAELGWLGAEVYRRCHVCRAILRQYATWQVGRRYRPRSDEIYQDGGFHEPDWKQIEHEYDKMAAISASIGSELVVVHIPQRGPWTNKHRYPASRLSAWVEQRNAGFIDLLPAMERASADARLYYEKDGHCTPAGHAVIAGELYRRFTEEHLVP